MSFEVVKSHRWPPSALSYMARALLPSPGFRPGEKFPTIAEVWSGAFITSNHIQQFREATDLDETSILFPHAFGFRALMATLTNRKFPLPIWNALQIRNHLVAYRRFEGGRPYDIETRAGDQRIFEKGIEIDLVTRIMQAGRCDWESVITFFYRGRFGTPSNVPAPQPPDLPDAPVVSQFRTNAGGGWTFGGLTGDYNGIHIWRPYARRLGFRAAFLHPQRAAGMCLARLPALKCEAQKLDLWIKGPVFYSQDVNLSAIQTATEIRFGLALAGDPRFAISGTWKHL